jgi:pSer/pThr/pTyr-binding forkhead associated (FHA) protein
VLLESEHSIGRSSECRLTIPAGHVSARHALIRWTGSQWELRDLGSTNGTFVDDVRLRPGESTALAIDAVVAFGNSDHKWRLIDAQAPSTQVIPLDGPPIVLEGDLLALPSPDHVLATIYRDAVGRWRLERSDDSLVDLESGQVFDVGGRAYRLSCSGTATRTSTNDAAGDLEGAALHFSVTLNEEHVEIGLELAGNVRLLPVRNHNYLLLLLARRRLTDTELGYPPSACGWTYKSDLLDGLGVMPPQLNTDVFRIRQQFVGLGMTSAIIERRASTSEIRIGVSRIEIHRI